MTPEQKTAVVDYFNEAREAIDGTGRHEGHALRRVGRCIYCSCGWRIGQGTLPKRDVNRVTPNTASSYRERHTYGPRPSGDLGPGPQ